MALAEQLSETYMMNKLQRTVIDSKNPKICYQFAKNVEHADIKALQKIVIDSKNAQYCESFAKNVKGANKKALLKAILSEQNEELENK